MQHLIVLAHPRADSFTRRVAQAYMEPLRVAGHRVILRDLYAMHFNPVASTEDLAAMRTGRVADDVQVEMDLVRQSDAIAFIAPVWWISTPAILKGWIDRVLVFGFAYDHGPDKLVRGLLKDKLGIVFTSSGSTRQEFEETGKMNAIRTMWGIGTVEFCAIRLLEHVHFAPVGSRSTDEIINSYLTKARDTAIRHFPPGR